MKRESYIIAAFQLLYSILQYIGANFRPTVDPEDNFGINSNFAQVTILTIETF